MKIRRQLAGLAFLLGFSAATSAPSLAQGLTPEQNLVCATVGVVACVEGAPCHQGQAQTFDVPTFMFIDFKEKIVHTRGEREGDASSPIDTREITERSIILQGIEEHRGWTLAIDRNTAKMTLSSTGPDVNFMILGNCTAN
jgi:hypothetical protein